MATLTSRNGRRAKKRRAPASGRAAKPLSLPPASIPTKILEKTADSKGRVILGGQFANRAVLVEKLSETEVLVKMARVIPEREAWLYENPAALASVRTGLAQARSGEVNSGPDLDADQRLISQLED